MARIKEIADAADMIVSGYAGLSQILCKVQTAIKQEQF